MQRTERDLNEKQGIPWRVWWAFKEAHDLPGDDIILINQSGRGDKDIFTIADAFADPGWQEFIRKKGAEYGA